MSPWTSLTLREILPYTLLALVLTLGLYLVDKHDKLKAQISSTKLPPSALTASGLESLPKELLDHLEEYRIIYYRDTIPLILPPSLRADSERLLSRQDGFVRAEIFTKLMRRNMSLFSLYAPQAWLLRLLAKTAEAKASFTARHIAACEFREGDLVCGVYRVLARREMRCEMGISASEGAGIGLPGSFGGRLVTSVVSEGGNEGEGRGGREVLLTETLQWVLLSEAEGKGFKLPLQRGMMRWMHELASWGLLVAGRKWLVEQLEREAASDSSGT